jgi:uncharacterized repeat protein (TIGR01451 family)/fimbrial isopeptide formation D2 family protein
VSTDPATGDLTLSFDNFRDLEPTESTTINITVSLAGDATWEVGNLLVDDVTAQVNDLPDGSGTWRQGSDSASTEVIPIKIVNKSANQSTGVGQATGTLDWPYTYTIDVQNNYLLPTDNIVITDTIPDGVEYLGMASGPAPTSVVRDNASGITTLTWNVGTLATSAGWTVTYNAGIRYDYFGIANRGTNRPHDDFDGDPPLGTPIPDKTPFQNQADLDCTFLGDPYSDSDTAQVSGCYATIEKSVTPTLVGNGTVVTYTINYYTSEYYNIDGITITDVLPDGQTYNADAVPAPDLVQSDTPGTGQTTLIWNALPEPMASGTVRTITFTATVDFTWQAPPIAGEDIVADDSMSNDVTIDATWHDEPDPTRMSQTTSCDSAAGVSAGLPSINKQVSLDGSAWTDSVTATVGDELYFRVRFNTADGASPIRSDIRFKDIQVTDWLPPGTTYVAGSYSLAYSTPAATYFLDPGSQYNDPPTPVTIGGLAGLDWWLGNIERGGWWEVVFRVEVDDAAGVAAGVVVNDLGKLAGENTFGQRYSDRDGAEVGYEEPELVLAKTATSVPSPLLPGSTVQYQIVMDNIGGAAAEDILVTDTLPVGMRTFDPTSGPTAVSINGTPLTENVDFVEGYDGGTGIATWDFQTPSVSTALPAGGQLVITYNSQVDTGVGAGAVLTDLATVGWNTQADGSGRVYPGTSDPADSNTDDETVTLASESIAKSYAPAGPFTIGDTVTFNLDVTVPQGMFVYWPEIVDAVNIDGVQYVAGSAALSLISGTPVTGASFDPATNPDPVIDTGPSPGTTFTWYLNNFIDNSGQPADYVFRLSFDVVITGLADGGGWEFWPPTAGDQFTDVGTGNWNTVNTPTRQTDRNTSTGPVTVDVDQPYLELLKSNDAAGPVSGGDTVNYTITIANTGWWTSFNNVIVDTLPDGMRDTAPVVTAVTLNGVPLTDGVDYDTSWDGGTGELTVDLTRGGAVDTAIPAGQALIIQYAGTLDTDVAAGSTLTNVASVSYNSRTDGTGRQIDRTSDPADENTDDSSVSVELAGLSKTCDAPGNQATIGQEYNYTVSMTVPAYTVIYNAVITDDIADGLEVDGTQTELDGVPTPIGSLSAVYDSGTGITAVTWDIGDYANNTASPQVLSLVISVHVKDTYHDGLTPVDGLPPGQDTFSNTADLQWEDADTGGNTYTDSASAPDVTAVEPRLGISKSWQNLTHPGQQPEAGDLIEYTIQLNNTGTSAAYGVTVDDTVPAYMTYDPGTITGPGADDTGAPDLNCDVGTIAAGAGATLTFRVTVDGGVYWDTSLDNTATLNTYYSQPQPNPDARDYGPASYMVPATARAAGLVVDKQVTGDVWVQPGDTVSYRVTVTNVGDAVAYNANVTDTIPWPSFAYSAGSTSATWSDGGSSSADPAGAPGPNLDWNLDALGAHINPGESLVLDFDIVVQAGASLGAHTNTAYGFSDDGAGVPTYKDSGIPADTDPLDEDSADITVTDPEITVTKTLDDADGFVPVGDSFSYTVRVQNTGNTYIPVVPMSDTYNPAYLTYVNATPPSDAAVPGTITWNDVSGGSGLNPGQFVDVTVNFTAASPGTSPDTDDTASVSSVDEHGDPVSDSDTDTSLTITRPEITVTKTLDHPGGIVPVGDAFSYTVRVENTGNTVIPVVPMTDTYDPTYLTYTGATPPSDTAVPGTITWNDVSGGSGMLPGQFVDVTVNFTAAAEGTTPDTDDTASVSTVDEHGDPVSDSDTDTSLTITGPGLTVTKTLNDGDGFVPVGSAFSYTIRVENSGDTEIVDPVPMTDTYDPIYLTYVNATPPSDTAVPGTITWNDISGGSGLLPGDFVDITVNFIAASPGTSPDTDDTAAASGFDENGDPVGDTDLNTSLTVTNPLVAVDKHLAPGQDQYVRIGDPVSYEITVTNTGDTTIDILPLQDVFDDTHLAYVDSVPLHDVVAANVITWNDLTTTFGDLAPGSSIDITVNLTATNLGLNIVDVATVSGASDEHGDPVPLATDDDNTLGITDPQVSVTKTLDDPDGFVPLGKDFSYTIHVENTGDTTIVAPVEVLDLYEPDYVEFVSAVPAADPASGGGIIVWPDLTAGADLPPGGFVDITVTFTALQPGTIPDTDDLVLVEADDEYGDTVVDGDLDESLTITDPELSLEKSLASGQPDSVEVGDTVTFHLVIENTGDTAMDVVPLEDVYEADKLEFVNASIAPDAQAAGILTWNDLTVSEGDLAPGGSFELLLTFKALAVADNTPDTAAVSGAVDEHGDPPTDVSDDASATIEENTSGVTITKSSEPPNYSAVVPGQLVTYTITCENTMEVPAENAVIEDYVDTTSEIVPGSIELNGVPQPDNYYDPATRLVTVPLGTLDPGESGTLVFQVTVNEYDEARPEVTNAAQITSDQTGTVVSFPTIVLPVDPLEFHKAVQDLNGGDVVAGDILLWTITVENIGSIPTTDVVVYDDVPTNTTYVPGSITGQGADDSNPARMRWNVGSIDVGVTVTLTFQSRVNDDLAAGTEIRNQAVLEADQLADPKLSAPEGLETAEPNILPVTGTDLYLFWLVAGVLILAGAALIIGGAMRRRKDRAAI